MNIDLSTPLIFSIVVCTILGVVVGITGSIVVPWIVSVTGIPFYVLLIPFIAFVFGWAVGYSYR